MFVDLNLTLMPNEYVRWSDRRHEDILLVWRRRSLSLSHTHYTLQHSEILFSQATSPVEQRGLRALFRGPTAATWRSLGLDLLILSLNHRTLLERSVSSPKSLQRWSISCLNNSGKGKLYLNPLLKIYSLRYHKFYLLIHFSQPKCDKSLQFHLARNLNRKALILLFSLWTNRIDRNWSFHKGKRNGAARDPAWTTPALRGAWGKWDGVAHLVQGKKIGKGRACSHPPRRSVRNSRRLICEWGSVWASLSDRVEVRQKPWKHITHMTDVKKRG